MPPAAWTSPAAKAERPVPGIALWSFLAFFLFSLWNVAGIFMTFNSKYEGLPIQPLAFALTCVMVIPWTKGKPSFGYFKAAWAFWFVFTVIGYAGPHLPVAFYDYHLIQLAAKMWISLIGIPLLAIRSINRDKLPFFLRFTSVAGAVGGALAALQMFITGPFKKIVSDEGRGAGFWVNPNSCAEVCGFCLFISLICPFRSKSANVLVRLALMAGVMSTLSRTGIMLLVVGFFVYGIAAKKMKTVFQVSLVLFVTLLAGNLFVNYLATTKLVNPKRIERISGFMRGDLGSKSQGDRAALWSVAMKAVSHDWIIGRGHRTMDEVVPVPGRARGGLGPHNYYIYVWGNSGIFALLLFCVYVITLYRMGSKSVEPRARSSLCAMAVMIAFIAMVDHSFLNNQFFGPVFTVMVTTAYYVQPQKRRMATRSVAASFAPPPVRRAAPS